MNQVTEIRTFVNEKVSLRSPASHLRGVAIDPNKPMLLSAPALINAARLAWQLGLMGHQSKSVSPQRMIRVGAAPGLPPQGTTRAGLTVCGKWADLSNNNGNPC